MFVGRKKEIEFLENLYNSSKFEMLIMHGRRRVGKSYLLSYFSSKHKENTVFFAADKSSEENNVKRFIKSLKEIINVGEYVNSINTWNELFSLIKDLKVDQRKFLMIRK